MEKGILVELRRAFPMGPGWALAGPWLGPALIKVQRNLSREVRKGPVYFFPELRFALA